MQREKLTPERIRKASCPQNLKQSFLWDTEAPRLAIRTTSAGAKSFIFEAKLNRETIRVTIGDVRVWLLDAARSEARRLQTLIDQGIDPREVEREKKEAKAEKKAKQEAHLNEIERQKRYTLKALCMAYVNYLLKNGKTKSASDTKSAFNVHVFNAWAEYSEIPAKAITSHQIAAIVRKSRETGKKRTAGILRAYLTAAFNCARRAPFDSSVPSALIEFEITDNPAEIIPTIPVNRGDRTLSIEELKLYMDRMGDDDVDLALEVGLLSGGQRTAQLVRAKVNDYDLDTDTLRLWDIKGKRSQPREHLIPLGPKAAVRVRGIINNRKSGKLFNATGRDIGNRVSSICADMGIEKFDLRDIRRTVETQLASMGIHKDIRSQLLSHGISGVQSAHYDRYEYFNEKHNALCSWERRLEEIASGESSSNVIPIPSHQAG